MKKNTGVAFDSIFLTAMKLITMVLSIVITMILSKTFSLVDNGTYSQGSLIISMASSITILGLSDGINFFFNKTEDVVDKKRYTSTIFFIQVIVGIVGACAILISQNLITDYFGNTNLRFIYWYIAFSPLLSNFIGMLQVLFVSVGRAKTIAFRNLFASVVKLIVVTLAAFIVRDIKMIFLMLLVTDFLQVAYFFLTFKKLAFAINFKNVDFSLVKSIFNYCLPLAVYILVSSLMRNTAKLIVGHYSSTETFAIFNYCSTILPFDILTVSFATVLIPYITKFACNSQYDKAQALYRNYLTLSYITTGILAVGAIIVSPELIRFLYSEDYLPGLGVFIIYIVADIVKFADISLILRAKGKSKALMIYSLVSLVANFVLSFILFQFFGIIGPALATLIVTFALNAFMLFKGASLIHASVSSLLGGKAFLVFIAETIGVGLLVFVFKNALIQYFDFNYLIILVICYGLFGLVIGLINMKKILLLLKNLNQIKM